jgi:hypothetical protein
VKADEAVRFRAGVFRLDGPRVDRKALTRTLVRNRGALRATGSAKAYATQRVRFASRPLAQGRYVYAVQLAATMNPQRTSTFFGRPFRVAKRSGK